MSADPVSERKKRHKGKQKRQWEKQSHKIWFNCFNFLSEENAMGCYGVQGRAQGNIIKYIQKLILIVY